jgi:hypothetical protein
MSRHEILVMEYRVREVVDQPGYHEDINEATKIPNLPSTLLCIASWFRI